MSPQVSRYHIVQFRRTYQIVSTRRTQLSWYHCLASLIRFPMPNRWILIVVSLMRELCIRCVHNLTLSVSELNFLIFTYLRGNLYQIVKFYRCYEKVASPMPQLGWYHYLIFIKISNNQKKWIKIVGSATRQLCVLWPHNVTSPMSKLKHLIFYALHGKLSTHNPDNGI